VERLPPPNSNLILGGHGHGQVNPNDKAGRAIRCRVDDEASRHRTEFFPCT
jgi:hypothetical protein